MSLRTELTGLCCVILLASCVLAGCSSDEERSSSSDSSDNSTAASATETPAGTSRDTSGTTAPGSESKTAPVASSEPVSYAPSLTDFRSVNPSSGTTVTVRCSMPGRLSLLDASGEILTSEQSDTPLAVCVIPADNGDKARLVQVRFEPASGSPGTQRMLPLSPGQPVVKRELVPPSTPKETWKLDAYAEKTAN